MQTEGISNLTEDVYDFIVVGAGASGCVLAATLVSLAPVSVLLLEAGGPPSAVTRDLSRWPSLFGSKLDWSRPLQPQKSLGNKKFNYPAGKVLGGSGATNAAILSRGLQSDFAQWDQACGGMNGWDATSMSRHFQAVESTIATSSSYNAPLAEALMSAGNSQLPPGFPRSGNDQTTTGHFLATNQMYFVNTMRDRQSRQSPYEAFVVPILNGNRPVLGTLKVSSGLCAVKLAMQGTRAVGLHCLRKDTQQQTPGKAGEGGEGREVMVQCRVEVALCCGAVGTPALLQRSGLGNPSDLNAAGVEVVVPSPALGRGLQDHTLLPIMFLSKRAIHPTIGCHVMIQLDSEQLTSTTSASSSADATSQTSDAYLTFMDGDVNPSMLPYMVWHKCRNARMLGPLSRVLAWVVFRGLQGAQRVLPPLRGFMKRRFFGVLVGFRHKKMGEAGKVTITSTDPSVSPTVNVPLGLHDEISEGQKISNAIELVRKIVNDKSMVPWTGMEMVPGKQFNFTKTPQNAAYFVRSEAGPYFHCAGSCAMGAFPHKISNSPSSNNCTDSSGQAGVVSPTLEVFGSTGLRVVDASVMPHLVNTYPYLTCLAIGHKGAHLMVDAIKSGGLV